MLEKLRRVWGYKESSLCRRPPRPANIIHPTI